jgi:hypothetical protein
VADDERNVRYPAYHPSAPPAAAPGFAIVAILAGLSYAAANGVPIPFVLGLLALLVALLVWGYTRTRLSATITGPEHLVVRRPPGSRTLPWRDVQEITVEPQAVWTAQAREPRSVAVVYDREGHRIVLPNIDNRSVASPEDEVWTLRELWEAGRGEGWQPAPRIATAIEGAQRVKGRRGGWLLISALAMGLLFCALVVVLVIVTDGPIVALILMGVLPVAAAGTAFAVLMSRQKDAEGTGDGSPPSA